MPKGSFWDELQNQLCRHELFSDQFQINLTENYVTWRRLSLAPCKYIRNVYIKKQKIAGKVRSFPYRVCRGASFWEQHVWPWCLPQTWLAPSRFVLYEENEIWLVARLLWDGPSWWFIFLFDGVLTWWEGVCWITTKSSTLTKASFF